METELWPNLRRGRARGGRAPSASSMRECPSDRRAATRAFPRCRGRCLRRWPASRRRARQPMPRGFAALGAPAPEVTGNLKFDVERPGRRARARGASCGQRFGATRRVWVAASTRDGEEALILDALAARRAARAHADRHRAAPSAALRRGCRTCCGSAASRSCAAATTCPCRRTSASCSATRWARCSRYYAAADVVFVGGSLLPLGGQNLIEPIAVGRPTLVGPHMFNFAEATPAGARGRRGDRRSPTPRRWSPSSARCSRMRRAARRCARPRWRFTRRTAARRSGLWAWLAPRLAAAHARRTRSAGAATVSPELRG